MRVVWMAANDSVRSIFIDICRYLLDDDDVDDALRIKTYGATSRTHEPEPDDNGVEHNNGFGPAHVLFVQSRDTCEPMWTNGRASERARAPVVRSMSRKVTTARVDLCRKMGKTS